LADSYPHSWHTNLVFFFATARPLLTSIIFTPHYNKYLDKNIILQIRFLTFLTLK
jgi:hypothetical protein